MSIDSLAVFLASSWEGLCLQALKSSLNVLGGGRADQGEACEQEVLLSTQQCWQKGDKQVPLLLLSGM